jgi:ABC-type glycerol-3-phosphate transport system permease component
MNGEQNTREQERETTTRKIALGLLLTFIALLVLLVIINVIYIRSFKSDVDIRRGWFELMKTNTILLGTALTTVIGYYFGQRESAQARKEAQAAEVKVQEQTKIAQTAEQAAKDVTHTLKEVTSRLPSTDPADFEAAKNNLPVP